VQPVDAESRLPATGIDSHIGHTAGDAGGRQARERRRRVPANF